MMTEREKLIRETWKLCRSWMQFDQRQVWKAPLPLSGEIDFNTKFEDTKPVEYYLTFVGHSVEHTDYGRDFIIVCEDVVLYRPASMTDERFNRILTKDKKGYYVANRAY